MSGLAHGVKEGMLARPSGLAVGYAGEMLSVSQAWVNCCLLHVVTGTSVLVAGVERMVMLAA